MKRTIALILAMILMVGLLTVPAVAAESESVVYNLEVKGSDYTVAFLTAKDETAKTVTGTAGNYTGTMYQAAAKLQLSFSGTADEQYVVFLLKDSEVPTEGSIRYINQAAGKGGTVTFNVYPENLTETGTYSLYVSGTDKAYTQVATFSVTNTWTEAEYILGDVDGNGKIDSIDALMVLQYNAQIEGHDELTEQQLLAADVNQDNKVDSLDALAILQINAAGNAYT